MVSAIDLQDNRYYPAKILETFPSNNEALVHYQGWPDRFDTKVPFPKIKVLGNISTIDELLALSEERVEEQLQVLIKNPKAPKALLTESLSRQKKMLQAEVVSNDGLPQHLENSLKEIKSSILEISTSLQQQPRIAQSHTPPPTDLRSNNEDYPRQIRIDGVKESTNRRSEEIMSAEENAVKEIFEFLGTSTSFTNIKRLGQMKKEKGTDRPRTILVTCQNEWEMRKVMSKAYLLKDFKDRLFLSRGLSPSQIKIENTLLRHRRELINSGTDSRRIKIRSLRLYVDGKDVTLEVDLS